MAPGSGGRSRAGAFQLPVCRRIVPTQRWGRNICRFARERGSVAVTTCVSAHQPAPVSFRNQSPHADRPFRMALCVGDFPWSSDRQNKRGDGDANAARGGGPDTPLNEPFRLYLLGLPQRHERDKTAHWQHWNRLKGRLNGCEFSVPTTTASTLQA